MKYTYNQGMMAATMTIMKTAAAADTGLLPPLLPSVVTGPQSTTIIMKGLQDILYVISTKSHC
jgi:hypothetical protein